MRMQDGGRAARAALPPVSQSVEELKSIVASARYAPVPPPQPQHLSAAERCVVFWHIFYCTYGVALLAQLPLPRPAPSYECTLFIQWWREWHR